MIFLYVIIALILSLLLIAAIMPKAFTLTAETIIDKPNAEVFNFVKQIKNQENYSVWVMADPNIKNKLSGY